MDPLAIKREVRRIVILGVEAYRLLLLPTITRTGASMPHVASSRWPVELRPATLSYSDGWTMPSTRPRPAFAHR